MHARPSRTRPRHGWRSTGPRRLGTSPRTRCVCARRAFPCAGAAFGPTAQIWQKGAPLSRMARVGIPFLGAKLWLSTITTRRHTARGQASPSSGAGGLGVQQRSNLLSGVFRAPWRAGACLSVVAPRIKCRFNATRVRQHTALIRSARRRIAGPRPISAQLWLERRAPGLPHRAVCAQALTEDSECVPRTSLASIDTAYLTVVLLAVIDD